MTDLYLARRAQKPRAYFSSLARASTRIIYIHARFFSPPSLCFSPAGLYCDIIFARARARTRSSLFIFFFAPRIFLYIISDPPINEAEVKVAASIAPGRVILLFSRMIQGKCYERASEGEIKMKLTAITIAGKSRAAAAPALSLSDPFIVCAAGTPESCEVYEVIEVWR